MNKNKRILIPLVLAAAAALVFSCIEFKSVVWPANPKANETIEVNVQVQVIPETEHN